MRRILNLGLNQTGYFPHDQCFHKPILTVYPASITENWIYQLFTIEAYLVTSKTTVKLFLDRYRKQIHPKAIFISIGAQTSQSLIDYGFVPSGEAKESTQEGMIECLKQNRFFSRRLFAHPTSQLARQELKKFFKNQKISLFSFPCYQTMLNKKFEKEDLKDYDAIFFTSPSCVRFFFDFYPVIPNNLQFIAIGEITKQALIEKEKKFESRIELILK